MTEWDWLGSVFQLTKCAFGKMDITSDVISMECYIDRLRRYFDCSDFVFFCALTYFDKYVTLFGVNTKNSDVHRFLLACLVVATKYVEDSHHTNSYYSQVGGVTVEELNRLELQVLLALEFNLKVDDINVFLYYSEIDIHIIDCSSCFRITREEKIYTVNKTEQQKRSRELSKTEQQKRSKK